MAQVYGMDEKMTVKEIVIEHLKANGYDGLFNEWDKCACKLDDFIPCPAEKVIDCEAGYLKPCDCGEDCDFHIGPKETETKP